MKLLIDVNVGGSVTDWLKKIGYDVKEVRSEDPKMPDEDILAWAVRENRILITTDNDFEKMIWQQRKAHCGVLRLENLPRLQRINLIKDTLSNHGADLSSGSIVIASQNKYRVRNPAKKDS